MSRGLWLTVAHVASYQHVARVTGAAVAAHGVVALVVAAAVPLAAFVHICKRPAALSSPNEGKTMSPPHIGLCDSPAHQSCFFQIIGAFGTAQDFLYVFPAASGSEFGAVVKWKRQSQTQPV